MSRIINKEPKRVSKKAEKCNSGKRSKKRILVNILFTFLNLLLIALIAVTSLLIVKLDSHGAIQPKVNVPKTLQVEEDKNFPDSFNILLVGADKRGKDQVGRSDTMIVANIQLYGEVPEIRMLSIPRDTRVKVDGTFNKINAAYPHGGTRVNGRDGLVEKTIEEYLDIKIAKTVEIDFESFKTVVDYLKGIEVNVREKMYVPKEGIDLNPGLQTLNGTDALGYVRFRYTKNGDFSRTDRQQEMLELIGNKIKAEASASQQVQIITYLLSEVKTDLTSDEALEIGVKILKGEYLLETYTLSGSTDTINGVSYVLPDPNAKEIVDLYFKGELIPYKDPTKTDPLEELITKEQKSLIDQGYSLDEAKDLTAGKNGQNPSGDSKDKTVKYSSGQYITNENTLKRKGSL